MEGDLKTNFEKIAEDIRQKAAEVAKLPNDKQLSLYGLFKQGSIGDNDGSRPWVDPKGKAKFDAWLSHKGKSSEDAMKEYIDVAKDILANLWKR